MFEFNIIKAFNLHCHSQTDPSIVGIVWCSPSCDWIKCNSHGTTKGTFCLTIYRDIFRDSNGTTLSGFALFQLDFPILFMSSLLVLWFILKLVTTEVDRLWLETLLVGCFGLKTLHIFSWQL